MNRTGINPNLTIDELREILEETERRMEDGERSVRMARDLAYRLRGRLIELKHGICCGAIVCSEASGDIYKVTAVRTYNGKWQLRPIIDGVRRMKNGKWALRDRPIPRDWEVVAEDESSLTPQHTTEESHE